MVVLTWSNKLVTNLVQSKVKCKIEQKPILIIILIDRKGLNGQKITQIIMTVNNTDINICKSR